MCKNTCSVDVRTEEGFGFCFLFSLISKKDEGILGIVFVFEKKKKKKKWKALS